MGDAARGESGGIGSIASGSVARRPYSNQRCGFRVAKAGGVIKRLIALCLSQPLSLTSFDSSPCGEPFGRYLNSYVKPPSLREVAMSVSELTEGVNHTPLAYFTWRSHISHCDSNISPVRRTDFTAHVSPPCDAEFIVTPCVTQKT